MGVRFPVCMRVTHGDKDVQPTPAFDAIPLIGRKRPFAIEPRPFITNL
jgi:hypothetical protein